MYVVQDILAAINTPDKINVSSSRTRKTKSLSCFVLLSSHHKISIMAQIQPQSFSVQPQICVWANTVSQCFSQQVENTFDGSSSLSGTTW